AALGIGDHGALALHQLDARRAVVVHHPRLPHVAEIVGHFGSTPRLSLSLVLSLVLSSLLSSLLSVARMMPLAAASASPMNSGSPSGWFSSSAEPGRTMVPMPPDVNSSGSTACGCRPTMTWAAITRAATGGRHYFIYGSMPA